MPQIEKLENPKTITSGPFAGLVATHRAFTVEDHAFKQHVMVWVTLLRYVNDQPQELESEAVAIEGDDYASLLARSKLSGAGTYNNEELYALAVKVQERVKAEKAAAIERQRAFDEARLENTPAKARSLKPAKKGTKR